MEENPPWEANSCSATQQIPRLFMEPEVHYHVPTRGPLSEPDESNPHPQALFLLDAFNCILPSMPGPPK
jgi:hypothetical protein